MHATLPGGVGLGANTAPITVVQAYLARRSTGVADHPHAQRADVGAGHPPSRRDVAARQRTDAARHCQLQRGRAAAERLNAPRIVTRVNSGRASANKMSPTFGAVQSRGVLSAGLANAGPCFSYTVDWIAL